MSGLVQDALRRFAGEGPARSGRLAPQRRGTHGAGLVAVLATPWELPEPAFLARYLALFVFTLVVVGLLRARLAGPRSDARRPQEPYLIAYLRGGALEPVQLAIARLIFRGELEARTGGLLTRTRAEGSAIAPALEAPLERAVYESIGAGATGGGVVRASRVVDAVAALAAACAADGLVVAPAARRRLLGWRVGLALALFGVGVTELVWAMSRGETPLVWHAALVVVLPLLVVSVGRGLQHTRAGHATLAALQRLRVDANVPPPASSEALLIAAAHGASLAGWEATVRLAFPTATPTAPERRSGGCGAPARCGSHASGRGCDGCGG